MSQFNMRRRLGLATRTGRRVAVAGAGAALAAAAVLSGASPAFAKPGAVMSFTPSPYSYGNVEAGESANAHVIGPGESSPHGLAVVGSHLCWASVNDETVFQANLDGALRATRGSPGR